LPLPDADSNCSAVETMRAMLARKIIRRRHAVGLFQVELARRTCFGLKPSLAANLSFV